VDRKCPQDRGLPWHFGITTLVHDDPEQATVLLDESLMLFREIGDNSNIAISLMDSALAALARGDHGRVLVLCEESLELLRKAGDRQHIADCLEIMAGGAMGGTLKAARLWGAAGALREEMGVPLQPENRKELDPCRQDSAVVGARPLRASPATRAERVRRWYLQAMFRDPDGNALLLWEPPKCKPMMRHPKSRPSGWWTEVRGVRSP
jgi:hypothetical protein